MHVKVLAALLWSARVVCGAACDPHLPVLITPVPRAPFAS
jgi:hypothetical protein